MNFFVLLNSLIMIFLMIMVGFAAGKTGMISTKAQGDFNSFVLNVTLPCTIINSMLRKFDQALMKDSIIIFFLAFVIFSAALFLNQYAARLFRVPYEKRPVWNVCCSLCNCGFMGYPVALAVFGNDGLFLAAILNISYNLVALTYGVKIMCQNTQRSEKMQLRKILLTAANVSVVIGLIFFLGQIPMPETIASVIGSFSNITTPLSMFLVGLSLSRGKLTEVLNDRHIFSIALVRLILTPLIVLGFMRLTPWRNDQLLVGITVLICAMPCATYSLIFAQKYGEDTVLASKATFFTSMASILTIPLIMMLV